METPIISAELLKEYSPIKDDAIVDDFLPYVVLAQKIYIRPVIGIPLYTELMQQIKAAQAEPTPEPYPITPENKALILEIAPALAIWATYQGLPFHWAAIQNKGLTFRRSENSEAADINDVSQLRRWLKDDAGLLTIELKKYLRGCSLYPLWSDPDAPACGRSENGEIDYGISWPKR